MGILQKIFGGTSANEVRLIRQKTDELHQLSERLDRIYTQHEQLLAEYNRAAQDLIDECKQQVALMTARDAEVVAAIEQTEQSPEGTIADLILSHASAEAEMANVGKEYERRLKALTVEYHARMAKLEQEHAECRLEYEAILQKYADL